MSQCKGLDVTNSLISILVVPVDAAAMLVLAFFHLQLLPKTVEMKIRPTAEYWKATPRTSNSPK